MNQFQIHTDAGIPVSIEHLDEMACELWGVPIHPKNYASPMIKPEGATHSELARFYASQENWFDKIGWRIAQGNTTWQGLKDEILEPFTREGLLDEAMAHPGIGGFIRLIDLWQSKGYLPVQLTDNEIISMDGKLVAPGHLSF